MSPAIVIVIMMTLMESFCARLALRVGDTTDLVEQRLTKDKLIKFRGLER